MILVVAGAILQGFSPSPAAWIIGRALAGAAASFWSCNAPVLINEIAYPSHRAAVSAFYQCGYYVGGTLAAWIIFATLGLSSSWGWRISSLLQLVLPFCAVPGLLLCPESPWWLASQQREGESQATLAKWHAAGDSTNFLVNLQMTQIRAALDAEKRIGATTSYMDMFKTKGNRRRLLITLTLSLFSQWGGNGVVSFYLTTVLKTVGITKPSEQLIITATLQIWNLLCGAIAASFVNRVGKRPLFHASVVVMLLSYSSITGLSAAFAEGHNRSVGIAVVPFLFIYFAGYGVALYVTQIPFSLNFTDYYVPFQLEPRCSLHILVRYGSSVSVRKE
jgi:MFS family permease